MIDAEKSEGALVAGVLENYFSNTQVAYIHLHDANRAYFSALVVRV